MFVFFVFAYIYWSYTRLYQLRFLFYVCFLCIYLRLLVIHLVISVEDLVLCLFSLYLFTSTGPKHDYISWGSCSMFVFLVFIYVYWFETWLYQLRVLFYVCLLCIYLRLLVLNMVISVEYLVLCLFFFIYLRLQILDMVISVNVLDLCLFSLYICTPPCLNHVDIS